MNIHGLYARIGSKFRKRRMLMFCFALAPTAGSSVLDLGGFWATWAPFWLPVSLTILNRESTESGAGIVADACSCPFPDRSFDIVFSNSLIEHLGSRERQQKFADEVRRLARKGYFVQTPNKWFPIEPHYLAPLVQFIPRRFRSAFVRWLTPRGWIDRPTEEECASMVAEIRLLGAADLQRLFPEATVVRERFLGLAKSLVAVHQAADGTQPLNGTVPAGNRKSREKLLKVLASNIRKRGISPEESALIVGGSPDDAEVLRRNGFYRIVSSDFASEGSRINGRGTAGQAGPLELDAENIALADDSFDLVFAHEVLHHCRSPHRALCEMLRVARKHVLFLEPNDSLTMRTLTRLGFSFPYELSAVAYHQGISGGVRDTAIPNFIYRWNRREVLKSVSSYMPERTHLVHTYPYWDFNATELDLELKGETRLGSITGVVGAKNFLAFLHLMQSGLNLLSPVRRQGNKIFCCIEKRAELKPWLRREDDKIVFQPKAAGNK